MGNRPYDLTPAHGLPWVPATAAPSPATAALRTVTLPLEALAATSLSPPECLPRLLAHVSAARRPKWTGGTEEHFGCKWLHRGTPSAGAGARAY